MADSKISALPASTTPLAGTEVLPIVQGGATKQVSVADLTAGRAVSVASLTASGASVISVTDNTNAALRITQLGNGNALLVEDSTNPDATPLAIDNSGRVAIGYTTTITGLGPSTAYRPSLQIHGTANNTSSAGVYNWSSTPALTSAVTFNRSLSNTIGTFDGAVTSGTSLGALSFSGDDSTSFYESVRIQAQADGNASAGSVPGRLTLATTPSGSTTPAERMRLDASGNLGIGTSSLSATGGRLQISGANNSATAQFNGNANGMSVLSQSGLTLYTNLSGGFVDTTFVAGNTANTYMAFGIHNGTSYNERMRLDSAGNVGIGTTANASAILDAQSTTKGVRMPNMTTTQKNAISSPAAGLMVFDTTLAKLCVYSGAAWQTITSV